jgi:hypothetical protein
LLVLAPAREGEFELHLFSISGGKSGKAARALGGSFDLMIIMVSAIVGRKMTSTFHTNLITTAEIILKLKTSSLLVFRFLISRAEFIYKMKHAFSQNFIRSSEHPRGSKEVPEESQEVLKNSSGDKLHNIQNPDQPQSGRYL